MHRRDESVLSAAVVDKVTVRMLPGQQGFELNGEEETNDVVVLALRWLRDGIVVMIKCLVSTLLTKLKWTRRSTAASHPWEKSQSS
jgi:hypothetical protein